MTPTAANGNSPRTGDDRTTTGVAPAGRDDQNDGPVTAPDDATVDDWTEAEAGRPDNTEETPDGLDDTDEELRHQAEDMPLDTPGRLR